MAFDGVLGKSRREIVGTRLDRCPDCPMNDLSELRCPQLPSFDRGTSPFLYIGMILPEDRGSSLCVRTEGKD